MSSALVVIVTVIYLAVGIEQLLKGNGGFGLMWCSYSTANLGLLIAGGAK